MRCQGCERVSPARCQRQARGRCAGRPAAMTRAFHVTGRPLTSHFRKRRTLSLPAPRRVIGRHPCVTAWNNCRGSAPAKRTAHAAPRSARSHRSARSTAILRLLIANGARVKSKSSCRNEIAAIAAAAVSLPSSTCVCVGRSRKTGRDATVRCSKQAPARSGVCRMIHARVGRFAAAWPMSSHPLA